MNDFQFDESALLSAVLSAGVIGGAVGLLDRGLQRAKYAVPLGLALGILLDYQLKRLRIGEHIEIAKEFITEAWDYTEKVSDTAAFFVEDLDRGI